VYRYILGFNAQDASGDYWLTVRHTIRPYFFFGGSFCATPLVRQAFNEVAEVLVGNSAENVNNFLAKEGNEKKYKAALNVRFFFPLSLSLSLVWKVL